MNIKLQVPKVRELSPRITVIGVGGAGGNAIDNMISSGLEGVDFVVANTDAQALSLSSAKTVLQLGATLTEGLGAGSKPEVGKAAAEEAEDEIRAQVSGSHMVFIAAGMGGGTGTGAAAVIARVARELGILTVAIVTKPFLFEGTRRMRVAEDGIEALKPHVDTLIVIPNQNLFRLADEQTTFAEAFLLADQVLHSGVSCIVDLIVREGFINLDFADVQTIMQGMGDAVMGTGEASGDNRAVRAAEQAIANPLLDDVTLQGAKGLLVSIVGGSDLTLFEVDQAANRVRKEVDPDANIIVGSTIDESLQDGIRVSIVASGMARRPVGASSGATSWGTPHNTGAYNSGSWGTQNDPVSNPSTWQGAGASEIVTRPSAFETDADPAGAGMTGTSPADAEAAAAGWGMPDTEVQGSGTDSTGGLETEDDADILSQGEDGELPPPLPEWPDPDSADTPDSRSGQMPDDIGAAISEAIMRAEEEASAWESSKGVKITPTAPSIDEHEIYGQELEAGNSDELGSQKRHVAPDFAPRMTDAVRRSTTRMPDVSDFPIVGQRDYYAKSQSDDAGTRSLATDGNVEHQPPVSSTTATQPAPAPARKLSLLERIIGRRKTSDSQHQMPIDHAKGTLPEGSKRNVRNGEDVQPRWSEAPSGSQAGYDEDADIPGFFNERQRH